MNQKKQIVIKATTFLMGMVFAVIAQAHIVLLHQTAEVGSNYKAVFKVGHGCGDSPITKIIISIPDGVQGAKPMVKPGWNILIKKDLLSKPYISHGKTITKDTTEIIWEGHLLPNDFYDEFVIVGKLPDQAGKIYWKVTQVCEKGSIEWSEVPKGHQQLQNLQFPAAELLLIKPDQVDHQHHH